MTRCGRMNGWVWPRRHLVMEIPPTLGLPFSSSSEKVSLVFDTLFKIIVFRIRRLRLEDGGLFITAYYNRMLPSLICWKKDKTNSLICWNDDIGGWRVPTKTDVTRIWEQSNRGMDVQAAGLFRQTRIYLYLKE